MVNIILTAIMNFSSASYIHQLGVLSDDVCNQ